MTIPPIAVQKYGQSIWSDNISRRMIEDGALKRLVEECGVLGVTSNPTIFQKAIGETEDYDDIIKEHVNEDANTIYEALAIRDIQDAADILRPVFERTDGVDGYISLEVSPLIANSTEKTVEEAQRLFERVERPNIMIKIPATKAGLPAIEAAIASGVNINVTLIFSVQNYEQVAEAYIRGLERRMEQGGDVSGIASVASFFLSRIDVMVDQMLENNIRAAQGRDLDRVSANRKLLGKAAISNAKLAYRRFQTLFEGERFAKLREAGAMVQRPLWASTGTKNPAYPDTMYVDELIGKHTVNTLPPKTLDAFADHGTAAETLTRGVQDAVTVMEMLAEVGVDMDQITHRLQVDGVDKFIDSFETLIEQVEAKRLVYKTGIVHRQKYALGIYRDGVDSALKAFQEDFVNSRLWAKDATVWKDHTPIMNKIVNRLGWLDVRETIDLDRLKALQASVKNSDWAHVVLLGMGGSSLAPEVLFKTFGQQDGFPDLHVLDSTNPQQIAAVQSAVDLKKTLFIVASKSGGTIETLSFYRYFYAQTGRNGDQFIAITDPDSKLQTIAEEQSFRDWFLNPADIGGRYSALSYFGMVPAALIGLDLDKLWIYATSMMEACGNVIPAAQHPGAWLGVVMGHLAHQRRDKVGIFTSDQLSSFGDWAEQLIAESTGKENIGILPVVGASVGKPHDYDNDRLFVYIKLDDDPSNEALDEAIKALREAGHPRITLHLPDPYAIAGEFFRFEYATAVAGRLLKINPFDEPNVTESKQNTNKLLAYYEEHNQLPQSDPYLTDGNVSLFADRPTISPLNELCAQHGFDDHSLVDLLAAQIVGTHIGDYFALLNYGRTDDGTNEMLATIRRRLRHVSRRAVTVGYGPRYLHSTGQLHKGGPNSGVFILLTHDVENDLDIPEATYSFGTLSAAQAAGDFQALSDHRRRALHLHVNGKSVQGALQILLRALDEAESRRH